MSCECQKPSIAWITQGSNPFLARKLHVLWFPRPWTRTDWNSFMIHLMCYKRQGNLATIELPSSTVGWFLARELGFRLGLGLGLGASVIFTSSQSVTVQGHTGPAKKPLARGQGWTLSTNNTSVKPKPPPLPQSTAFCTFVLVYFSCEGYIWVAFFTSSHSSTCSRPLETARPLPQSLSPVLSSLGQA